MENNAQIVTPNYQVDMQDKIHFDYASTLGHNHHLLKLKELYIFFQLSKSYQELSLLLGLLNLFFLWKPSHFFISLLMKYSQQVF